MSFSLNFSGLLTTAATIFNQLFPVFGAIAGLILGIGLIQRVIVEIRKAF